jgi:hypothetical protein
MDIDIERIIKEFKQAIDHINTSRLINLIKLIIIKIFLREEEPITDKNIKTTPVTVSYLDENGNVEQVTIDDNIPLNLLCPHCGKCVSLIKKDVENNNNNK